MNARTCWLLVSLLLAAAPGLCAEPVQVTVDCSQTLNKPPILWGHVNVSRRAPPPKELCGLIEKEFGRPEVTRCWLMLDQAWDYRTDTYRFDYEINKDYYQDDPAKKRYGVPGFTTGLHYYDYLDSVSAHSKTVLMNIRRYEQEVVTGMLSFDKWKEVFKSAVRHYKQRCPNLRYIEVLNEPTASNQSNIKLGQYYGFYRRAYEAINELNAELDPDLPLLVGGNSGFRTHEVMPLIRDFAQDPSPEKRLDFLSFHHYWVGNAAAEIAGWEAEVDQALKEAWLPTDLPIFVTEIGYALKWKEDPKKNLWQAAGMTAYQYQARHSDDLRLFPWVQYHSEKQISMVQFDKALRMTPFGAAVKMLTMHKNREVASKSTGMDSKGAGLGSLATIDDTGLVIEVWNLQSTAATANVAIRDIPEKLRSSSFRIRQYLIDSTHSNCFSALKSSGGLEQIAETTQPTSDDLQFEVKLEPMALCLWTVEPTN